VNHRCVYRHRNRPPIIHCPPPLAQFLILHRSPLSREPSISLRVHQRLALQPPRSSLQHRHQVSRRHPHDQRHHPSSTFHRPTIYARFTTPSPPSWPSYNRVPSNVGSNSKHFNVPRPNPTDEDRWLLLDESIVAYLSLSLSLPSIKRYLSL